MISAGLLNVVLEGAAAAAAAPGGAPIAPGGAGGTGGSTGAARGARAAADDFKKDYYICGDIAAKDADGKKAKAACEAQYKAAVAALKAGLGGSLVKPEDLGLVATIPDKAIPGRTKTVNIKLDKTARETLTRLYREALVLSGGTEPKGIQTSLAEAIKALVEPRVKAEEIKNIADFNKFLNDMPQVVVKSAQDGKVVLSNGPVSASGALTAGFFNSSSSLLDAKGNQLPGKMGYAAFGQGALKKDFGRLTFAVAFAALGANFPASTAVDGVNIGPTPLLVGDPSAVSLARIHEASLKLSGRHPFGPFENRVFLWSFSAGVLYGGTLDDGQDVNNSIADPANWVPVASLIQSRSLAAIFAVNYIYQNPFTHKDRLSLGISLLVGKARTSIGTGTPIIAQGSRFSASANLKWTPPIPLALILAGGAQNTGGDETDPTTGNVVKPNAWDGNLRFGAINLLFPFTVEAEEKKNNVTITPAVALRSTRQAAPGVPVPQSVLVWTAAVDVGYQSWLLLARYSCGITVNDAISQTPTDPAVVTNAEPGSVVTEQRNCFAGGTLKKVIGALEISGGAGAVTTKILPMDRSATAPVVFGEINGSF